MIKKKFIIIGSISLSNIIHKKSAELGIYSNPFINTKGDGEVLEEVAVQYAHTNLDLNKIYLEVYFDNEIAINFYKKCGFKLNKIIKNGTILCMEKVLLDKNEQGNCLVPQSYGVSLPQLQETNLREVYYTLMPRLRQEFDKKYKTLQRQSLY